MKVEPPQPARRKPLRLPDRPGEFHPEPLKTRTWTSRFIARRLPPSETHSRHQHGVPRSTSWSTAVSQLDVGSPDHLAPLLGLVSDQPAEISRTHRHWFSA